MNYTSIKGMHDILPPEMEVFRMVEDAARRVFSSYGYMEISTPILEGTDLFERSVGASTSIVEKEMYTFKDLDGKSISLRPEGTASIVRAYIEQGRTDAAKYMYFGPMFRHESPQKGRFRQFHQIGVEALGIDDPACDAEQIAMADHMFKELGLNDIKIEINSLGCKTCRPEYNEVLHDFLRPRLMSLCENCRRRLTLNPLRVLDCKDQRCIEVSIKAPDITKHICGGCQQHFFSVQETLKLIKVGYTLNPRIVRGLDYYVRTAVEFTTTKLGPTQNAVGAGGRYDGLVADLGGPDIPGVGFALGIERLMLLIKPDLPRPALTFFAILSGADKIALPIIQDLRRNKFRVERGYGGSLKSQMRLADKLGAKTVVIVGEDEVKKGVAVVRDMHTKEQEEINLGELIEKIKSTSNQINSKHQIPNFK